MQWMQYWMRRALSGMRSRRRRVRQVDDAVRSGRNRRLALFGWSLMPQRILHGEALCPQLRGLSHDLRQRNILIGREPVINRRLRHRKQLARAQQFGEDYV